MSEVKSKVEQRHRDAAASVRMAEYAIAQQLAELEAAGYAQCQADVVAWLAAEIAGTAQGFADLPAETQVLVGTRLSALNNARVRIARSEHIGASDSKEKP